MDFLQVNAAQSRPMALLVIPLILGIVLFDAFRIPVPLIFQIITPVIFGLGFIASRSSSFMRLLSLMMLLSTIGWMRAQSFHERFESQTLHTILDKHRRCELVGRIVTTPESRGERCRAILSVSWVIVDQDYRRLNGKVLMNWPNESDQISQDDLILAFGTLSRPDGQRNPGEFNYRSYLMRRGVAGLFYVGQKDLITSLENEFTQSFGARIFGRPRVYMEAVFDRYLSGRGPAGLLKGLILGQKGDILPETRTAFADAGVVHVLAVSGLHVGFVAMFLFLIVNTLRMPARWKPVFLSLGLLYFAGLTGFKPPVVRAVTMAIFFLFGRLLQQKTDIYNMLLAAGLLILIISPYSLFEPGFQLSFTAVFGIAFFYSRLSGVFAARDKKATKGVGGLASRGKDLALVSLSAQVGTLPLTMIYFEQIPLLAILANLVVVPLVQAVVILGFVLVGVSFVWEVLARGLGTLISFLLDFLSDFVTWLASLPFARVGTSQYSPAEIVVFFVIISVVIWLSCRRRYGLILNGLLLAAIVKIWLLPGDSRQIEFTFLDVGQGDAAVVRAPRFAFLIDSGPWTRTFDAGQRTIAPYLRRNGIKTIDAIFSSHPHTDHIGGLVSLLLEFEVKEVFAVDPGEKVPFPDYRPVCDSLGVKLTYVTAGDTISRFAPLKISVLSPFCFMLEGKQFDTNNRSMVLQIRHGENRFVFSGDAEHESEDILTEFGQLLRADVLKVGHHGSETSSTQGYITRVGPKIAIIPVGRFNRFGHPSDEVVERFRKMNVDVLRTDTHGAIRLRSDGEKLQLVP